MTSAKESEEPILAFAGAAEWRAWLKANHARSRGVLLRIAKGKTMAVSYAEALDAALAWGWIDSRKQALDADAWLRFTPRTAKSPWSKINRAKAEALIAAGAMQAPGLAEIARETRRPVGRTDRVGEREPAFFKTGEFATIAPVRTDFARGARNTVRSPRGGGVNSGNPFQ